MSGALIVKVEGRAVGWCVVTWDGEVELAQWCGSREAAMERAAALAGVKL